jgi:hypothetical protein
VKTKALTDTSGSAIANEGQLDWDPDGTGAQANILLANLVGKPALNDTDFVIL